MNLFKKRKEIKRLNLNYIGHGIYKSIDKGCRKTMNGNGVIISECNQTMVRMWKWNWLLREFDLIYYDLFETDKN